jgi:hypothetical protein
MKWAWRSLAIDVEGEGPFDTRQEAEAAAEIYCASSGALYEVGYAVFRSPKWLAARSIDMDDILDRMDADAVSSGYWGTESELFGVRAEDMEAAKKDLERLLEEWVERWIHAEVWQFRRVDEAEL